MFEAREVMTRQISCVTKETPIYTAMNLLIHSGATGIPVVDGKMNLVGLLSEKDVLHILTDSELYDDQPVSKFMSTDIRCFAPEDSAVDICDFLIKNPYHRVPIVDKRRLVGVISRTEIIKLILRIRGKLVGFDHEDQ